MRQRRTCAFSFLSLRVEPDRLRRYITRMSTLRAPLLALCLSVTPITGQAHPHVFIDTTLRAVVDEDGGAVAQGFVDVLAQLDADGVFSVENLATVEEAEAKVTAGDLDAALVIPVGFSDAVAGGSSRAS